MNWFDWVTLGWFALNAILMVALVGRPREPITPGTAAIGVLIYAGFITSLVLTR